MSADSSKTVVVTGASTGIGWGCVKVLTEDGWRVFAAVRRTEDAERLTAAFGDAVRPLILDVTDSKGVAAAASEVDAALGGKTLAGLVNNAGIAVAGPLLHLKIEAFERQLAVNLTGPLIVTQAFAPLLGADRSRSGPPGRIVMMSSVGGLSAPPFVGAYSASKFGLEGLSESLRRELMLYGIDVVIINPGVVATPIWGKSGRVNADFAGTPYAAAVAKVKATMLAMGKAGLPPERIGEAVRTALSAQRPKVRYIVTPTPLQDFFARNLPKRLVDRLMADRLGLAPSCRR
ncbi:SDR family NAD(P)-dependent oxidoreductase [Roseiarcus sp.]|uniref:SDR family NAD(P)-dependent oxidoreductase n=1 Tax=Roseiarcus sp. TaxID=1969460 RepID=UPI003F98EDF5